MEYISEYGVLGYQISDHAPVFLTKKKNKTKRTFQNIRGRTYKNYDKSDFQQMIKDGVRWLSFRDPENTVDDMWKLI